VNQHSTRLEILNIDLAKRCWVVSLKLASC
jgi:hypothetical protein